MIREAQSQRPDAEALAWFHSAYPQDRLDGVNIPILAMVGAVSFDVIDKAADAIATWPNATKAIVPGQAHNWDLSPMATQLVKFCSVG